MLILLGSGEHGNGIGRDFLALFLYCIRRKWINCCTILLKSFSAIAETVRRFHAIVADGHIGRVRCLRRSLSKVKDLQKHSHNFNHQRDAGFSSIHLLGLFTTTTSLLRYSPFLPEPDVPSSAYCTRDF